MRPISPRVRRAIDSDLYYRRCARTDDLRRCNGRITMEHAFIYGGRQIDEIWAIIPLCEFHHLGDGLEKRLNELIALRRATTEDLEKYPRRSWLTELEALEGQYGHSIARGTSVRQTLEKADLKWGRTVSRPPRRNEIDYNNGT